MGGLEVLLNAFLNNPNPDLYIVITDTFDGESLTDIFVETDDIVGVGYTQEQLEIDKTLKNP